MRALQERMKMERDAIAIQKDEDEDSDDEDLLPMTTGIDWKKYGSKYDDEEEEDDTGYRDVEGRELEYTDDEDEFDTAVPLEGSVKDFVEPDSWFKATNYSVSASQKSMRDNEKRKRKLH